MNESVGSYNFEAEGKKNPYDKMLRAQEIGASPSWFVGDCLDHGDSVLAIFNTLNSVRGTLKNTVDFNAETFDSTFYDFVRFSNNNQAYYASFFRMLWNAGVPLSNIVTFVAELKSIGTTSHSEKFEEIIENGLRAFYQSMEKSV